MTLLIRAGSLLLSTTALGDILTTDARPLAQPVAPITITAGGGSGPLPSGILFTDLDKYAGYTWNKFPTASPPNDVCTTYGMAKPQNWGPSGFPNLTHTFADIDLGPAPDWADFLELSVNLTQSTVPNFGGAFTLIDPWPCEISQGDWMDCEGGCCPVEAMVGLARQFWVDIVGRTPTDPGRIVLRRQQSVTSSVVIPANFNGSGNPAYAGLITHHIDDKVGAGNNSNLGQSNACSIINTAIYATAYTGTLLITPVNYSA